MANWTAKKVARPSDAPASGCYLNKLPNQRITDVRLGAGIGRAECTPANGGFRNQDGRAWILHYTGDGSRPWSVPGAFSWRMSKFARSTDGRWCDARVTLDASGDGKYYGVASAGVKPLFFIQWQGATVDGSACARTGDIGDFCGYGFDTATGKRVGTFQPGIKVKVHVDLLKQGTDEPFPMPTEGMAVMFVDIDQFWGAGYQSYRESIRLGSGVGRTFYVSTKTKLNVSGHPSVASGAVECCEENGWLCSPTETDESTWDSSVVFYVTEPSYEFEWTGFGCGTGWRQEYVTYPDTERYPRIGKLVGSVAGKEKMAETAPARRGDIVDWVLDVSYPYVVGAAAAKTLRVSDTFDSRLDVSQARVVVVKLKDEAAGVPKDIDVTGSWMATWERQTLRLEALDPEDVDAGGTYRVVVSGTAVRRGCALDDVVNTGTVVVESADPGQGTVSKESGPATLTLGVRFRVLKVTKRAEKGEWDAAFGRPAFPVKVSGTAASGDAVEKWAVLAPEPGSSEAIEVDVSGLEGSLEVTELADSGWQFHSLTGSGGSFRADGQVGSFDLDSLDDPSDGVLQATFTNRFLRPDGPRHSAHAVNEVR